RRISTCCPGRCPRQLATSIRKVFIRGVSTTMSRTSATCHSSRRAEPVLPSVTVVPLFFPWIPTDVIPGRLTEARLVGFHERQAPQPFGALPEIEMRHEQSGGSAVHRLHGRVGVTGYDRALAAHQVIDSEVGCIAALTMSHDVGRWRLAQSGGP